MALIDYFSGASHRRIPVKEIRYPVTIVASDDTIITVIRLPDDAFETKLFNPHHDEYASATTHLCIPQPTHVGKQFTLDGITYCNGRADMDCDPESLD